MFPISLRNLAISMSWAALSVPLLLAADLSSYRNFQLGMNLLAVEKQADIKPSEAKTVHQRPAMLQDLEWRPRRFPGPAPESDPVKDILFMKSFLGMSYACVTGHPRHIQGNSFISGCQLGMPAERTR